MKVRSAGRPTLTPAQRGQIVQRVIVDGWTSAEAAAAFGVSERFIDAWVADYRRRGMASLRHTQSTTIAAEIVRLRLLWPLDAAFRRIANAVRWLFAPARPARPAPSLRSSDDRRGGGS